MEEQKEIIESLEKDDAKIKVKDDKKMKNIISLLILFVGLFIGSLFVDISQIIKGGGFSTKKLNQAEIFEANGKTWVAFSEPVVNVKVVTDDKCEKCDPSKLLVWLRRVLPTISVQKVSYDSEEGKALIDKLGFKTLPMLILSDTLNKTEFYTQAQTLFEEKDNQYIMRNQELGMNPAKYLELPKIGENDIRLGNNDSKVKVITFTDFECPYCKTFHENIRKVMKQYGDKALFVFKNLPLAIHPKANDAAMAGLCANEQNKFWEYSDKLFSSQADWSKAEGVQKFKDYAKLLKLNTADFNKCLDERKYQDKLDEDKIEAASFGISATPAIFVNDQYNNGAASEEGIRNVIEEELNK